MMRSFLCLCLILTFAAASRPASAEKLTVLLDWFVNPNHGPLIVAQELGAYQRAGLEVEFVQPADPTMPPRLVAAGHADVAIDYQAQLYSQVTNGLPLVRIGVLLDKSLQTLMTLDGYGIKSLADLKGKRVGYNEVGGAENLAMISRMLSTANLTMKDVTLVNVGTALSTSLLTHRVDAIGVYRNFEGFELSDKGAKPIGFDYEKFGVPQLDDLVMVVNKDTIRDPRFPRFLTAVREGAAYITAHPDEAWKLFIHAYPDLDNKLNHDAWFYTVPYFAADPASLDTDKYNKVGEFLVAQKVIPAMPPLASFTAELK